MFEVDDEKYRQRYIGVLEPKVPAPIRAIGMLSRPGAMTGALLSQVSGAASLAFGSSGKKKAGGLPMNVVLAATDDEIYVFEYKPKGRSIKVKDPIVVWPRAAIQVEQTATGTFADRLTVHIQGQEPIELDSNKMPGFKSEFNAPLFQLLGGPAAS